LAVRLCLTLPLSERGGRPKCNCRLRRVNDPASGEGVLSSVVALRDSEVAQKPGNWQVRRRPRQRKERGDQDPRPPIVVGRHASAPITAIAAKRAPVRAEAEFLNDWLTRASKRPFSAQDVVGATGTRTNQARPSKRPSASLFIEETRPRDTRPSISMPPVGAMLLQLDVLAVITANHGCTERHRAPAMGKKLRLP